MEVNLSKLRLGRERFYFWLIFLISLFLWGFLFYSIFGQIKNIFKSIDYRLEVYFSLFSNFNSPLIILFFFLMGIFSHFLAIAYIRMNGIKVSADQFPEIFKAAGELSQKLNLKKTPDVFVILGNGVLNAFAVRLITRKIIVIYSDLAEALIEEKDQKQLEAVIAHELGHHALGHTSNINWFLTPGMLVPFLGNAFSRAREYSADRVMKVTIVDNNICHRGLIKLAAGKVFGQKADIEVFKRQAYEESGFFSWFAEITATHPHLPKRIIAIERFNYGK